MRAIQPWKRFLECLIPTPQVMLEFNLGTINHLKPGIITRKLPQPLLIFFHNPNLYDP